MQWQKIGLNHVPNYVIIDDIVAVNEDVAECNNSWSITQRCGDSGIDPGSPIHRLADDLELALDGTSQ